MILLLNGAFGIGKTTAARALVARLPSAMLFDPETIGWVLQRVTRVEDFQDLRAWRRLTILGVRIARRLRRNVVVPMAISNVDYLREIQRGLGADAVHVCLVAPLEVVEARIRERGATGRDAEWQLRRAAECCAVHGGEAFAVHVDANRDIDSIVDALQALANQPSRWT